MLSMVANYVLVSRAARRTPGFLFSAFSINGFRSCIVLSFWSDEYSIASFGTDVPSHVAAAHRYFGWTQRGLDKSGPELWSTRWHLAEESNNARWGRHHLHKTVG
jgi:hypothetical protein